MKNETFKGVCLDVAENEVALRRLVRNNLP